MSKFPQIDWNKEYPTPKPFSTAKKASFELRSKVQKEVMRKQIAKGFKPFPLSKEDDKKRREKINATKRAQREERLRGFIPRVKKALRENGNSRKKAAESLGVKTSYLSKLMRQTKGQVDWSKEFPCRNLPFKQ